MSKISFLFLFFLCSIFSCVNPSSNKNVGHDSIPPMTIRVDTVSQYLFPARTKAKAPNDALIPEKMTAAKIIGVYYFTYGNWAIDLKITTKKIAMRWSIPDTLNEGWVGTWKIKSDT